MIISFGIPEHDRDRVADLYWQAFEQKLGLVMGPSDKGRSFVRRVLMSDHALCAHTDDGALLGVAGFKTHAGALVSGTFADLRQIYGLFGASWRGFLLNMLERDTENRRFLMDGIFVAPEARGRGVGTALLGAITDTARDRGYEEVRLDVIDSNDRARALYEREGFTAIKTARLGPLRHIFGFRSATTMVRAVHQPDPINAPAPKTNAPPSTT
ncbi:Acetyltransferase (GNAT) family protein [Cognatiyoonia koreensis]|uniref:Acetyltransferase (GNAT) family protein n=1 Tax=Cognatiyoonia koreensis TaxID=364200 RepID=A0A1I0RE92_9RHOB|nr:GNAT family N-acetyltransferase [Cognatiyoonia koreensis]SEW39127.1 Acetyltransferase (GNAT) family protein [Cognatiyoonia koreensis]